MQKSLRGGRTAPLDTSSYESSRDPANVVAWSHPCLCILELSGAPCAALSYALRANTKKDALISYLKNGIDSGLIEKVNADISNIDVLLDDVDAQVAGLVGRAA